MCAGKRFSVENNLARLSPKLAAQWHPSRNTDRTAASVTAHSSHRAWWRCDDCGHEWQASVNNRARGAACPVCALTARVLR
jgi:rubrerythrin